MRAPSRLRHLLPPLARSSLAGVSRDVVRSGLGALRQLSNSDGTKRLLAERGAAGVIMRVTVSKKQI